ncbi:hypothetical protein [Streptomyces cucumeris]|uniref:hypothetical protein n=1 Tax=Streptomyces cucumeris TaxID=2962890 RepID=UPI003D75534B
MSNDYAAIITTVNAAILLVGTVQHVTLMKKSVDTVNAEDQALRTACGQVIEEMRRGVDPSPGTLNELRPRRRLRRRFWQMTVPWAAALVWMATCMFLVSVQSDVLRWAGTAKPDPEPRLARFAFYVAVGSTMLLVIEAALSVLIQAAAMAQSNGREYKRKYTAEERARLEELIKQPQQVSGLPDRP